MPVLTEDHPYVILSRGLKGRTEDGPRSTKCNCLNTAKSISERTSDETSNQSAEIVNRDLQRSDTPEQKQTKTHDSSLQKRIVDDRPIWALVAEFHNVVVVIFGIVDPAHHSLVITKKEDGQASNAIDSNQQATLLQLMDHVASRN